MSKKQSKAVNRAIGANKSDRKVVLTVNENQPSQKRRRRSRRKKSARIMPGMSPYMQSILDPWSGAGVKIPDECTQVTSTWQSRTRVAITLPATQADYHYAFVPGAPAGSIGGTAAPSTTQFPTPTGGLLPVPQANYTSAATIYSQYRVVSAGVKIACMQSGTTNQGIIYSALWPRGVAYPSSLQFNSSELTSINRFADGVVVTYRSLDNLDREFVDIANPNVPLNTPSSRTASTFLIKISGAAPSAVFLIDFIVNYETVVNSGFTGIVDAEPSPVNEVEFLKASEVGEAVPPTAVGDVYEATVQAGSSPMEKLADIAEPITARLFNQRSGSSITGTVYSALNSAKRWGNLASGMASLAALAAAKFGQTGRGFGTEFKTPY